MHQTNRHVYFSKCKENHNIIHDYLRRYANDYSVHSNILYIMFNSVRKIIFYTLQSHKCTRISVCESLTYYVYNAISYVCVA